MSGGRLPNVRLSSAGVSPVRIATWTSRVASPRLRAASVIPASGARRLRLTSWTRAFSGETYRTRSLLSGSSGAGSLINRSRHHRNAARVLPDPVGAQISVCCPAAIFGQPSDCADVGSANAARNQSAVAGEKLESGSETGAEGTGAEYKVRA